MKIFLLFKSVPALFFTIVTSTLFSQNVGIGTTAPTKGKLEVYGAVGATSAIFGGDGAGISLQRNYPGIGYNMYYGSEARMMRPGTALVQFLDYVGGGLVFDTYGAVSTPDVVASGQTRRYTIRQNGNFSINTYQANASLFVTPGTLGITTARFRGTNYHSVFCDRVTGQSTQHTYISGGKPGSHVFINDQGLGNVYIGNGTSRIGINSADPSAVIEIKQVAGRGLILVAPANSFNNWGFTVNHEVNESKSDLWVYYNEGYKGNFFSLDGLYYQASDRRLKTAIAPLKTVLQKVMMLKPVLYEMRNDNAGKIQDIGFIAQQVGQLFPTLVQVISGNDNGYKGVNNLHTMNYDGLGPIAIKAIQEQQQQIEKLKAKNSELRQRLEAAENALTSLHQ